jgi:HNH endonuclease
MEYSEEIIWQVWSRGEVAGGNDPVYWRKDLFGAWLYRGHYENRNSEYGWIIDHIKALDKGGTDNISNLRPLQWENSIRKADSNIEPHVTSEGVYNVRPIENNPI